MQLIIIAKTALEVFFLVVRCSWGGYPDRQDNDVIADMELSILRASIRALFSGGVLAGIKCFQAILGY